MTAQTVAQFLHERGYPVSESDLVEALRDALDSRVSAADAAVLSPAAERVLVQHSGMEIPDSGAAQRALRDTTADVAALVQTSLSVPDVAALLDVDASRIRHRLADREMYSIRVGRSHRLPAWQFYGGRPLPGLRDVLGALPRGLHPATVEGFMSTPQEDLVLHGMTTTPRHWLAHGGDPLPVAALARGFDEPY
jgi:hypothetical protein